MMRKATIFSNFSEDRRHSSFAKRDFFKVEFIRDLTKYIGTMDRETKFQAGHTRCILSRLKFCCQCTFGLTDNSITWSIGLLIILLILFFFSIEFSIDQKRNIFLFEYWTRSKFWLLEFHVHVTAHL